MKEDSHAFGEGRRKYDHACGDRYDLTMDDDRENASEVDAALISLQQAADLDSTIKTLADLPTGWAAERTAVDKPWQRHKR